MKAISIILALISAAACADDPVRPTVDDIRVSFPEESDAAGIPYRSGGRIVVEIGATIPSLCDRTRARVDVLGLALTDAGPSSAGATVTLIATPGCKQGTTGEPTHRGVAHVAWPPGGPVDLEVRVLGVSHRATAPLEVPTIGGSLGAPRPAGRAVAFPLCVESSTIDGTVELSLDGATVGAATSQSLRLIPGTCADEPLVRMPRSHAEVTLTTTETTFAAHLRLTGTAATARVVEDQAAPPTSVVIGLTAATAALPPPGGVVRVEATASNAAGTPLPGIPVAFAAVPATEILPESGTTDASGTLQAHVVVPEAATALRIEAIAGTTSDGVTLTAPP